MLALFDAVWEGGNHPIYLDQMVKRRRKSRFSERVQVDLIRQFVAGATACTVAHLVGVNRHTATLYFHKLRELIALKLAETEPWLSGEIEVDKSNFGSSRKGKRGRSAAGKVPLFGLLRRGGKVHVVIIPNAQQNTLVPIIRRTIEPDRIVYTGGFLSYNALDVSEFRHHRIHHSENFLKPETVSAVSRTSGTRRTVIWDASMAFPENTSIS